MSDTTATTTTQEPRVVDVTEEPAIEESIKEEPVQDSKFVQHVKMLYANFEAGQKLKGALSMTDCRATINAKKTLIEFDTSGSNSTKETLIALEVFIKACEGLQATGVFNMEGSVLLLESLEALEAEINSRKDPSLKMQEMKDRLKNKK